MPFLLGLTGNIACGKSTVGKLLVERHGVDYVDADLVVHALYEPGTPEYAAIVARFGKELVRADGSVDRTRLGQRVLSDPAALRDLESILHPGAGRAIAARIGSSTADVVVVDAIKLLEAGFAAFCDAVWVVTCDRESQIRRLRATRGLTHDQAVLRVDAQAPQEEKARRATAVIENRGSLDDLVRSVEDAWTRTVAPRLAHRAGTP